MQAQRILFETWRKGKRYSEAMHVVKGGVCVTHGAIVTQKQCRPTVEMKRYNHKYWINVDDNKISAILL